MAARFEKFKGANDEYYFKLAEDRNDNLMRSEGYTTAAARDQRIASVRVHAPNDAGYERSSTTEGKWYFNLRTSNSSIVCNSQMYDTILAMEAGINEAKSAAANAVITDETGMISK